MPVPDYQSLMLPLLRLAAAGEQRIAVLERSIADQLLLSQTERDELLPSGRQRVLHNRLHWAKFYMSKAGLLASSGRGVFEITDAGRLLLAANPHRIDVKLLMERPQFREFYKGSDGDVSRQRFSLYGTRTKYSKFNPGALVRVSNLSWRCCFSVYSQIPAKGTEFF